MQKYNSLFGEGVNELVGGGVGGIVTTAGSLGF